MPRTFDPSSLQARLAFCRQNRLISMSQGQRLVTPIADVYLTLSEEENNHASKHILYSL